MSQNELNIGRPSVNVPTTGQTARAKQVGKTTSGVAADTLTVKRESAGPQYSANVVGGGPELPTPEHMNATDLMAMLFSLRKKHTESSLESAEQRIQDRSVDKAIKSKEMIDKLKKVAEKKSNVGGTLAKVFAWVGVALSFLVAGIIGVVSGGAAAAPLLMIAAMSAALLIAQQSGGMEKAMDAMGMDDKAKMGFSLGLTAMMLVINIVAVVASGGASAVGVAAKVAESTTEVAATASEATAEVGATVAEAAAEISTTATEAAVEAATQTAEAAMEVATQTTEAAVEVATQTTEAAVEVSSEATGAITKVATEATEATVETSTKVTEGAVKTTTDVAENVATKAPTAAVKAVAEKLGTSSSRVMQVVDKVRSGVKVAEGVTQVSVGGLSIGNATKGYEASMARAGAMRDKAVLAKMQAQDEDDMRRIRNMIERLENAQRSVMSTISRSDEVSLQIRQTI